MTEFGREYADLYDAMYAQKDYAGEADVLERVFERYGGDVKRVLDLGCGTGRHAVELGGRGFEVIGVDRSEGMLGEARSRAAAAGAAVTFELGDLRNVRIDARFDAVLMMFAVLGYQIENQDVRGALRTARSHMETGGLLVFDVWYGPAVLHLRPEPRFVVQEDGDTRLLKASSGRLVPDRNTCEVDMQVWAIEGDRVVRSTHETHTMRYFFAPELRVLLEIEGFELLRLGGFPDLERAADENTWNVLVVATAV